MVKDDKIKYEKLQYQINREPAKISVLLSGKIDKYEYFTGEEILPSDQSRVIEPATFKYYPIDKAFEKQIKTIEDQGIKRVEALAAQVLETIKGIFQKIRELVKSRVKQTKMKNWKKKFKEKFWNMK